ncbi:cytochrome b561 and DOMON domain-containing protein At5g35735-like [Malania oleifera]|uniref:cytochrome b561 and DOMON domain-containing protein At5g35735-like n=1 Tax=Malania oleifera TaxID=397392 RepID=UPI0025AEB6CD|nr:cytochrome b561 and DOMON domain-containing protein At5g35735-like [Malania oleifera]
MLAAAAASCGSSTPTDHCVKVINPMINPILAFTTFTSLVFILLLSATPAAASSSGSEPSLNCTESFRESIPKNYKCRKLNTLGAEFAWTLSLSPNSSRVDIVFRARLPRNYTSAWVAWGVNPGRTPQMAGTRALIAIVLRNQSSFINTYNVTADTKLGCALKPSDIDVAVVKKNLKPEAEHLGIWATLDLDPKVYNVTRLNHVWQVGHDAEGTRPMIHPTTLQNVDSAETIDLTGKQKSEGVGRHRHHLRVVHGILNIVGWGTLLPAGVIIARYLHKYPIEYKSWKGVHVGCQIVAYTLGTVGWFIGLWLGHASKYYSFRIHRILAILIFTFTTLQMLALRLRPGDNDEYRKYWNMYHHFLGYALIAVISVNIFHGIDILKPDELTWKWAYIGLLALLASITLAFEIFTWVKFCIQKSKRVPKPQHLGPIESQPQLQPLTNIDPVRNVPLK